MKSGRSGRTVGQDDRVLPTSSLTGRVDGYVFRGERDHDRPMSDATLNAALRALGYAADKATGHGFRATARTLLSEELGFRTEVIEAQLAHAVRDANGRAYNRTEFITDRKLMMARWAKFLDELKAGEVVNFEKGPNRLDPEIEKDQECACASP